MYLGLIMASITNNCLQARNQQWIFHKRVYVDQCSDWFKSRNEKIYKSTSNSFINSSFENMLFQKFR